MRGVKKNGEPAKPKKDGTARIANGGYDEKKQRQWCESVLTRATATAMEIFGNAAEIVVARYAAIDSGYEGCCRLFKKKHGLAQMRLLVAECAQRLSMSGVFAAKYKEFLRRMETANIDVVLQSVAAKRSEKSN